MSIEGQGHSFTIYFPDLYVLCFTNVKISGERLQDQWSSGYWKLIHWFRSKMPLFLSYNSSNDLVPNQGSVEILDPDRGHIMLSFPYKFLLTSIKKI